MKGGFHIVEHLQLVRAVSPADIGIITRLATGIWRECYERSMENGQIAYMLGKFQSENAITMQILHGAIYKMAYYLGRPVGYYGIQREKDVMMLLNLYLEKPFRRKGIGREMVEDILSHCQEVEAVEVTVSKTNPSAVSVYGKMGFSLKEEKKEDIGAGYVLDQLVMRLELFPVTSGTKYG